MTPGGNAPGVRLYMAGDGSVGRTEVLAAQAGRDVDEDLVAPGFNAAGFWGMLPAKVGGSFRLVVDDSARCLVVALERAAAEDAADVVSDLESAAPSPLYILALICACV